MTTAYLPEATINVLSTSATFDRDYSVDPAPYIRSGRNNWIPAPVAPSAEELQSRKEFLENKKKAELKPEVRIETKPEVKLPEQESFKLTADPEAKSRNSKPKDKE